LAGAANYAGVAQQPPEMGRRVAHAEIGNAKIPEKCEISRGFVGGGGNRTRVLWSLGRSFYVRVRSIVSRRVRLGRQGATRSSPQHVSRRA